MPEQPPDPRDYDMRIPPSPDSIQKQNSQTSADQSDAKTDTAKDTGVGDEKSPASRSQR